MSPVLEELDKVLHEVPARSVQMAQRLLDRVKADIASGKTSRGDMFTVLVQLYDEYAERGCTDEREAVADVLDVFDKWAPLKATG